MNQKIGNIPEKNLTHKFLWNGKEALIGKIDLAEPTKVLDCGWEKLGNEIMDQLECSEVFTQEELENLAMLDAESFLNCIHEV